MRKWLAFVGLSMLATACGGASAAGDGAADPAPAAAAVETAPPAPGSASPAPRSAPRASRPAAPARATHREVTLPDGTALRLELLSGVASDSSQVEDRVRATLREAVSLDGVEVLPAGTELSGIVTEAERSGRVKGLARVAYRFDSLRYDAESYGITTATIAHEAEPTKREDTKKVAIAAGAGAAVGALLGGGSGAVKGAAIGGAGGTGAVLATRGEEVRLGPGTHVTTQLTAPLVVRIPL